MHHSTASKSKSSKATSRDRSYDSYRQEAPATYDDQEYYQGGVNVVVRKQEVVMKQDLLSMTNIIGRLCVAVERFIIARNPRGPYLQHAARYNSTSQAPELDTPEVLESEIHLQFFIAQKSIANFKKEHPKDWKGQLEQIQQDLQRYWMMHFQGVSDPLQVSYLQNILLLVEDKNLNLPPDPADKIAVEAPTAAEFSSWTRMIPFASHFAAQQREQVEKDPHKDVRMQFGGSGPKYPTDIENVRNNPSNHPNDEMQC